MSSRRERSGGSSSEMTFEPVEEIFAEPPITH